MRFSGNHSGPILIHLEGEPASLSENTLSRVCFIWLFQNFSQQVFYRKLVKKGFCRKQPKFQHSRNISVTYKSRRPEVFWKFTEKNLWRSLFFNKVAGLWWLLLCNELSWLIHMRTRLNYQFSHSYHDQYFLIFIYFPV